MSLQTPLLILFAAALLSCSVQESPPVRPSLEDKASLDDSYWEANCQQLPDDKYKACYGPGWEAHDARSQEHYDFYEVSVELNIAEGSRVLYDKRLQPADVPAYLLTPEPQAIIRFDEDHKTVSFILGPRTIEFTIQEQS